MDQPIPGLKGRERTWDRTSLGCPLSPLMGALYLKPMDDALDDAMDDALDDAMAKLETFHPPG